MWLARIAVIPVALAAVVVAIEAAYETWHYVSGGRTREGSPVSLVHIVMLSLEAAVFGWLANRLLNSTRWFSPK